MVKDGFFCWIGFVLFDYNGMERKRELKAQNKDNKITIHYSI